MTGRARRTAVATRWRPARGYASAFVLRLDDVNRAPEWWAREALGAPPAPLRWLLAVGWRYGLGLRLARVRAPGRVQGWAIERADGRQAVLAASSRWLQARNVFTADTGSVTWTTVVEPRHAVGRVLWAAAAPLHELSVPWLLARAARRARSAR